MSDTHHPIPARKTALAPDVRRLDERAARAWTERMAVRPLGESRYAVDSQSGATYVVDVEAGTCTCPDNRIRDQHCKHLRRVGIEITTRRVPPPGKRAVSCTACGVEAFVPVDDEPPHLCGACLLEPGDVVRDRETGDRLVVAAVTDRRAHEVVIEGVGTTVADYETNDGYPHDDLVVEAIYAGDFARSASPRRYSFPRSRLERADDAAVVDSRQSRLAPDTDSTGGRDTGRGRNRDTRRSRGRGSDGDRDSDPDRDSNPGRAIPVDGA